MHMQNYTLFSSRKRGFIYENHFCRSWHLDSTLPCADWLPGFFGPSPSTSLDEKPQTAILN
jgi:hypothetical protein